MTIRIVQSPGFSGKKQESDSLREEFPDRVLWGTDWPHPNLRSHMPDDGALVDLIPAIAPTALLQRKLLVDNPRNLYWDRQET